LSDSALLDFKGEELAFTTDSFVVSPLFFRGGDIGKLAVCGSVNDLVVAGSQPLYLSLALIIEEGLDYSLLEKVVDSIAQSCRNSGVKVVTGDIKVVEKGACDKLFINTSGIGRVIRNLEIKNIRVKDKVIITGRIAEHGLSILSQRNGIDFGVNIKSDCQSLEGLLLPLLNKCKAIKFMRDPTRGGLATTLNEIAQTSGLGIVIDETSVPISSRVRAACELLGIDPLYIANEGKAIMVVEPAAAENIVNRLRQQRLGRYAGIIGSITREPKAAVVLNTGVGTSRILDMLISESLPRIC
ncbi:MAG: hydrogenase expression/formation protein HypE, partial [Candidatus Omnitrophica bacterium]|nr:hydrogenase expression/formation protein HypE [Candidatus Omnitrophota bacterium]